MKSNNSDSSSSAKPICWTIVAISPKCSLVSGAAANTVWTRARSDDDTSLNDGRERRACSKLFEELSDART